MSDMPARPTRDLIRMVTSTPDMTNTYLLNGDEPSVRALGLRASDDESASPGTIFGYPIVFSRWTEIDSWWEGHFLERIDPGAIDSWLKMSGSRIRNLFQHGMDFQIGDKPLGKPAVQRVDELGLYSETPLSDTDYNRDQIAPLIRDGVLDGQSFRFSVLDEEWRSYASDDKRPDYNPEGLDERTITRMQVPEYGPVTFPAYETTTLGLRTAVEYAAWKAANDDVRAAMLDARGITNAHDVVQQVRNNRDRPDVKGSDDEPPAERDSESDVQGDPGRLSQTSTWAADAKSFRTKIETAKQEAARYV